MAREALRIPVDDDHVLQALSIIDRFDRDVRDGNADGIEQGQSAMENLVNTLNGGTNFGSFAGEHSPGVKLRERTRCEDGLIPKWGQCGRFLVECMGILALVKIDGFVSRNGYMGLYCVEPHVPFISQTGFRNVLIFWDTPRMTVKEFAEYRLQELIGEGLVTLSPDVTGYPEIREIPYVKERLQHQVHAAGNALQLGLL